MPAPPTICSVLGAIPPSPSSRFVNYVGCYPTSKFIIMEIYLSPQCESLTGSLGRGFGYYIRSTKKGRYYSQRSKHSVPPDGHWRFILTCAELAHANLHVIDVKASCDELADALWDAHHFNASEHVCDNFDHIGKKTYDARDIINLKYTFGL